MQISRHWRMNSQRYRLQGVRYEDGCVSLQARPVHHTSSALNEDNLTDAEFDHISHTSSRLQTANVA